MTDLLIKYNELTTKQFSELWETIWGDGQSLEQTELAMQHTASDCEVVKFQWILILMNVKI